MPTPQTQSSRRYNEKTYERIECTVPKGHKAEITAAAKAVGISVNAFIKEAINEKIERMEQTGSRTLSVLSPTAKWLLTNMIYAHENRGQTVFFKCKTNHVIELLKYGFCSEQKGGYADVADKTDRETVIEVLQAADLRIYPPKKTPKYELRALLEVLEEDHPAELRKAVALLGLTEKGIASKQLLAETPL